MRNVVVLEWGEGKPVGAEPTLELGIKNTTVTKKKKSHRLELETGSGALQSWAFGASVSAKLKVKNGAVKGFKKKGGRCYFRHLVSGFPGKAKFKLVVSDSRILGKVGETLAFKLLCRKSRERDNEGKVYAAGLPRDVWVVGAVKPDWN